MRFESLLPALWNGRRGEMDPFQALRRQMDELFNEYTGEAARSPDASVWAPRINVSETDKELKITADLPGVEQKDIEVSLADDRLTIRGEKRHEAEEKKDEEGRQYHRVERSYGMFQRTIALPCEVNRDQVQASFKDGVLTVTMPKPAEAQKQARKIEVKPAGEAKRT